MRFDSDSCLRYSLQQIDEMICHSGDCLARVLEKIHPESGFWDGLVLIFPTIEILIGVRPEDDSVELLVNEQIPSLQREALRDVSSVPPWEEAVGQGLLFFSVLLNNRGFTDGVQMEFSNSLQSQPIIFQVIGIASNLHLRAVNRICHNRSGLQQ